MLVPKRGRLSNVCPRGAERIDRWHNDGPQGSTPSKFLSLTVCTALVEDEPVAEGDQDDPIDPDDEPGGSCDTVDAALRALETSRLSPKQVAKEDQRIPIRECDEVVLNYSLPVVARAIQFGERRTDVRSLGYGVMKRLKVLCTGS